MGRGRLHPLGAFHSASVTCLATVLALVMFADREARGEEPEPPPRPTHNINGMTGLIDLPSADMQPDAQLSFTSGYFGGFLRNTLSAQIFPGVEAAFRYSILNDFFGPGETLYDRSFDVKFRFIREGPEWPSVVLGFQDFLGTGIYSGEYFAGTKHFFDGDLAITGGIGWGRFAGTNSVGNPLCFNDNTFCTRAGPADTGGTVNFGDFFSGKDMGFFGGLSWRTPIDGLVLKAEYSDDEYTREGGPAGFEPNIPLNFGAEYRPLENIGVGAYYMYGSEFGVRVTISVNPFEPLLDFDDEPAGRPIQPRPAPDPAVAAPQLGDLRNVMTGSPAMVRYEDSGIESVEVDTGPNGLRWATATLPSAADYVCPDQAAKAIDAEYGLIDAVTFRHADGTPICTVALRQAGQEAVRAEVRKGADYPTDWYDDEAGRQEIVEQLVVALDADQIGLFGIDLKAREVSVYIENQKFRATPRAVGRTARALAAVMPPSVELFEIIPVENSLPVVSVMIKRSSLEDYVGRPDAARSVWLSASVQDAEPRHWRDVGRTMDLFPRPYWSLEPAVRVNYFDPDSPVRADLDGVVSGGIEFLPGLSVNGSVAKRIVGNLDQIELVSDSVLPRVRSDNALYLREGDPGIQRFTGDYLRKLDDDIYGRLSVGLLEGMFGGVSGEVLWQPVEQSWGLGLEMNWVKQRDFNQLFGFRDYDVFTGHASLYWDTGWYGVSTQVDVGRYLAGDWGGTLTVKRRFPNGWELGAFATFTDVPFSEFGEGSFDKGLILTIPLNWTLPFETRSTISTIVRPVTRDGGQRLIVSNRLYPIVQDMGRAELRDGWQGFWK